jgi:hypothetical protein
MKDLSINTITFGKYKDKTLDDILKDRNYCKWLLEQEWFQTNYEYLYNRVKEYDPKIYFFINIDPNKSFIDRYQYFNLNPLEKLDINLSDDEKKCYNFYLNTILELKNKIIDRMINCDDNPFDIKAPTKWLQNFEKETGVKRDIFKDFIHSYDLPNITTIIEDIKKEGGIEYKGAKSFIIAKKNSESQEKYWEQILKEKYGEDIGTQFKYENCIFDFINIKSNTIYECKIGLKDFNEEQYKKYLLTLNKYKIVYLISNDCIIDINTKNIYTLNSTKYLLYQANIFGMSKPSKFDILISDFNIIQVENIVI